MNNIHIVTVATDYEYYLHYLIDTCKRYGKELEILGFGEKWKGFNWKFKLMIDYLNNLPDTDIVCFIDGYDVICLRNLDELEDEFIKIKKENNCSIIVGHDKTSFIMSFNSLYFGKCNNTKLNSGTYIGYVKDLLFILINLQKINSNDNSDDQYLMTQYCNLNKNLFYIDTKSKLFLSLSYPLQEIDDKLEIKDNIIYYQSEKPFFIHAPGYTYLDNLIIRLNYDYDYNHKIKDNLYNNFIEKKIFLYTKNIFMEYYIYIIIFIIIIFIFWKYDKFI